MSDAENGELRKRWLDDRSYEIGNEGPFDACPECGGTEWSTASDGLGDVASVAAVCFSCRYVTVSVVDLTSDFPPADCDHVAGYYTNPQSGATCWDCGEVPDADQGGTHA